jgi:hypothetical protein
LITAGGLAAFAAPVAAAFTAPVGAPVAAAFAVSIAAVGVVVASRLGRPPLLAGRLLGWTAFRKAELIVCAVVPLDVRRRPVFDPPRSAVAARCVVSIPSAASAPPSASPTAAAASRFAGATFAFNAISVAAPPLERFAVIAKPLVIATIQAPLRATIPGSGHRIATPRRPGRVMTRRGASVIERAVDPASFTSRATGSVPLVGGVAPSAIIATASPSGGPSPITTPFAAAFVFAAGAIFPAGSLRLPRSGSGPIGPAAVDHGPIL